MPAPPPGFEPALVNPRCPDHVVSGHARVRQLARTRKFIDTDPAPVDEREGSGISTGSGTRGLDEPTPQSLTKGPTVGSKRPPESSARSIPRFAMAKKSAKTRTGPCPAVQVRELGALAPHVHRHVDCTQTRHANLCQARGNGRIRTVVAAQADHRLENRSRAHPRGGGAQPENTAPARRAATTITTAASTFRRSVISSLSGQGMLLHAAYCLGFSIAVSGTQPGSSILPEVLYPRFPGDAASPKRGGGGVKLFAASFTDIHIPELPGSMAPFALGPRRPSGSGCDLRTPGHTGTAVYLP